MSVFMYFLKCRCTLPFLSTLDGKHRKHKNKNKPRKEEKNIMSNGPSKVVKGDNYQILKANRQKLVFPTIGFSSTSIITISH